MADGYLNCVELVSYYDYQTPDDRTSSCYDLESVLLTHSVAIRSLSRHQVVQDKA